MKILGPVLVAALLLLPTPAACDSAPDAGAAASEERPDVEQADPDADLDDDAEAAAEAPQRVEEDQAEPETPAAVDEDGEALDPDDQVEVRGLVYEYFLEDDGKQTQLGIEAPDGDYLVRGAAAGALAKKLGETVTARGWIRSDASGDRWLWVEEFDVEE